MNPHPSTSVARVRRPGSFLALLLLLGFWASNPPVADAAAPPSSSFTSPSFLGIRTDSPASVLPLWAASWWEKAYRALENALMDNPRRTIQFAFVGMVIALFIIWWKKK